MTQHYSIFISDVHLGTRGCQAEKLNQFLKKNHAQKIYLVGDIIDGWRMRRGIYWPQAHSEVIRTLLKKEKEGCSIYYIAGNHDEFLRKWMYWDLNFGRIKIINHADYICALGKRYLVIHGDMFDGVMRAELKWLAHVGDFAYNALIWLNTKFNWFRLKLGMKYWSLSKFLKQKTKKALNYIDNFEDKISSYAKNKNYHGVICGHIHHAQNSMIDGIHYINTGDWVESCTAVVQSKDGNWSIIDWSKH
jgi:UDP-2,3-diacylglucosamine pyrophosphatase LpxH